MIRLVTLQIVTLRFSDESGKSYGEFSALYFFLNYASPDFKVPRSFHLLANTAGFFCIARAHSISFAAYFQNFFSDFFYLLIYICTFLKCTTLYLIVFNTFKYKWWSKNNYYLLLLSNIISLYYTPHLHDVKNAQLK